MTNVLAPAISKARRSPCTPSPAWIGPVPVSPADNTTTTALTFADTINVLFPMNTVAKAAASDWDVASIYPVAVFGTAVRANDNADPGSLTVSGLDSGKPYTLFHCIAHEGPGADSWSPSSGYFGTGSAGTTGGIHPESNMSVRSEAIGVFGSTSYTVDATYKAADHAQVLVAFGVQP